MKYFLLDVEQQINNQSHNRITSSFQLLLLFQNILTKVTMEDRKKGGRRDRMVVGFTTTCAISAYHH